MKIIAIAAAALALALSAPFTDAQETFQTFGDLANFNPHLHVLAADGVYGAEGTFIALPPVPEALLAVGFRRAVLEFLSANEALSVELCA
jgi:hypothetical protein